MKKYYLLFSLFLFSTFLANAQNYWKKLESYNLQNKSTLLERNIMPKDFEGYSLDKKAFVTHLRTATKSNAITIVLPDSNGIFSIFKIRKISNFEKEIARKFSSITSYSGKCIKNPDKHAYISIGSDGVHVMITSGSKKTIYIDPLTKNLDKYLAYKKEDINHDKEDFICLTNDSKQENNAARQNSYKTVDDGKLRTFRIAIACTGEYSLFHLSRQNIPSTATDQVKKAAVLSAMNTTMTRVNAVYQRDMAVRMVLVNDNDKIIFLDPSTDNLSNDNASLLINESQSVCDNIITPSNYDIGHTFSTGGGGLAGLGVVCISNQKARGITGRQQPIGDPFDIDYVAHEIGHQFGATHTFNNFCNGNRTGSTAVEPGSGSTIMAYAGICSPNIQSVSDDYFHAVSIAQMWEIIQTSATCATLEDTNNIAPTVVSGGSYSIPKLTPFVMKANASDDNGVNALTYTWEQIDNEIAASMPPEATNIGGPLFRSLAPSNSPDRYFPAINTVISGNTGSTWEVLPSVARELNFALTVRDNNTNGGANSRDDVTVNVVNAPIFTVTNLPNLEQNETIDVAWVVGKTNETPINCKKVNIKLSTDGGSTFPVTLATNTDNDGQETITLPNTVTTSTSAYIMVEAADNIFYNITSSFGINTTPNFAITNTTGDTEICNEVTTEIRFNFDFLKSSNYTENVSLSIQDLPPGATSNLSAENISENGNFYLDISNLENVLSDSYEITLNAQSTSFTQNIPIRLNIIDGICTSSGTTQYNTSTTLVRFNTIDNATPNKTQGYNDFTAISTLVQQGESIPLTVYANTDGAFQTKTFAWFDWNQNCKLDPEEEYDLGIVNSNSNGITSNSPLQITIPENAELGNTLLRISTKYLNDGDPAACETNFDGEVEDYTVVIDAVASTNTTVFENFKIYPNPSDGAFQLSFLLKNEKGVTVKLYDIRGRVLQDLHFPEALGVFSENLNFDSVKAGMYLLQVQNGSKQTISKLIIK
ncbi:reprolysin-like metallopeptidase [Tenacibaculum sp. SG-28]|uniref:zinc-dependent metalloprotease n=1 Tax=Tenacibaculum sp. SG-28 TaxID=754426 RepID=UPI000CF48FB3|nr:zinc-dependent metalloprotease family protein [Tenacibaculum sp. SG-28]PQJ22815.1 hypothetical protein BSU00_00410 [Tenacibaculum sp. SG-28]